MNARLSALTPAAWVAIALAFVIGLFVGWLLLGYLLFPVSYTNADPWDLNAGAKEQYVAMVADSFSVNHDLNQARSELRGFKTDELTTIIRKQIAQQNQQGQGDAAARLGTFAVSYGLTLTTTPATTPGAASGGGSLLGNLPLLLLILLLVIVVVGLALLFYSRIRAQDAATAARAARREEGPSDELPPMVPAGARPMAPAVASPTGMSTSAPAPRTAPISMPAAAPAPRPTPAAKSLGTFAATYKFGDDNYDTAFTLETARNEFLGECGMGISETIGEGKPDKVTAFDLWLFDKTDVRTVTQILMTDHAYNDQALRSRLAQKGELTLAEKGKHIPLQTATLRVDATIVDLVYASTPGLPPNSHFQKLIVEMVATQK